MDKAVLDSSILLKAIFKPLRSLTTDIYEREMETHRKCRKIVDLIDEKEIEASIPRCCIVEMAAVSRRLSDRATARKISTRLQESYEIAEEALLFDMALIIATDTGCSGFDSYFIALAKVKKAKLLTDDNGMQHHGKEAGVDAVLVRDTSNEEIERLFLHFVLTIT